jgi:hypothetical protein
MQVGMEADSEGKEKTNLLRDTARNPDDLPKTPGRKTGSRPFRAFAGAWN